MKANLYDLEGKKVKEIDLPIQFEEPIREDLIKKAILSIRSHNIQPYGANPTAGQRASAVLSKRRRNYKGSYGHGISRVPRKSLWKRGLYFGWVGAFAPGTVKGRKAHPPKATRNWSEKINKKEKRKAIRSALSATVIPDLVKAHGHKFEFLPTIVDNKIENLKKTKEVKEILTKLGLKKELERISIKKIRAGKGKTRGRKYKTKKGPLLVVTKSCSLEKSAKNITGIDICLVNKLNAEILAPGIVPGRLTIYTEDAIKEIDKKKLFTNQPIKEVKK